MVLMCSLRGVGAMQNGLWLLYSMFSAKLIALYMLVKQQYIQTYRFPSVMPICKNFLNLYDMSHLCISIRPMELEVSFHEV